MRDDVSDVFLDSSEHAEAVTYQSSGSSPVSILAVVNREEGAMVVGAPDGRNLTRRATLFLSTSSTNGVGSISEQDSLYFDGYQWKTEGRPMNDGFGMQTVNVVSIKRVEISKENYRLNRS